MSVVWLRCRTQLRAKWRNMVVLVLLVGIGGGIGVTALAGARRTDQAVPQFVTYSLPDDGGFLFGSATTPPVTPGIPADSLALPPVARKIVHLPQVVAHFRAPYLFLTSDRTGRKAGDISAIGIEDADMFRKVDRRRSLCTWASTTVTMVLSKKVRNRTNRSVARATERELDTLPSEADVADVGVDLTATVMVTADHGRGRRTSVLPTDSAKGLRGPWSQCGTRLLHQVVRGQTGVGLELHKAKFKGDKDRLLDQRETLRIVLHDPQKVTAHDALSLEPRLLGARGARRCAKRGH